MSSKDSKDPPGEENKPQKEESSRPTRNPADDEPSTSAAAAARAEREEQEEGSHTEGTVRVCHYVFKGIEKDQTDGQHYLVRTERAQCGVGLEEPEDPLPDGYVWHDGSVYRRFLVQFPRSPEDFDDSSDEEGPSTSSPVKKRGRLGDAVVETISATSNSEDTSSHPPWYASLQPVVDEVMDIIRRNVDNCIMIFVDTEGNNERVESIFLRCCEQMASDLPPELGRLDQLVSVMFLTPGAEIPCYTGPKMKVVVKRKENKKEGDKKDPQ